VTWMYPLMQPEHYLAPSAVTQGSTVGQHLRHSIDHYAKCLAVVDVPVSAWWRSKLAAG
jgi:hypothetical protein